MKLTVDSRPGKAGDISIRFVLQDQRGKLQPPVTETEFSAKANTLLYVRTEGVIYAGLGERAGLDSERIRVATGAAVMHLKGIGKTRIALKLIDWPQHAAAAVEGAILADYRFEEFKAKKTAPLESVHVQLLPEDVVTCKRACERGRKIAEAVNYSRSIANLPGNILYPAVLAQKAEELGAEKGLKVTVFDERKLKAGRFGGLLAVGGGAAAEHAPRLIVVEHQVGKRAGAAPLALVGKAITFDSGGISIKGREGLHQLIYDKCGGTAVLGAMAAIADLEIKKPVTAVIAAAENLPSALAYRPGDIITAHDGKTIEVIDTDAEGRVVLADAISHARLNLKASAIIDLATLTGACGVALGEYAAGFWSSSETFAVAVHAAANKAGERVWPMPLFPEYETQTKSDVAVIKNYAGRLAGACTGAAFLKAFAEDTPWAHLDIAYMASRDKDQPHMARGATGFGVRTLVQLAESWAP